MEKKYNILLFRSDYIKNNNYTAGYLQLSNALKKLGHKVILFGLNSKTRFEQDLVLLKMPFNKRSIFMIELFLFLPVYCVIKHIDVVIVNNRIVPGTLFLLLLKKLLAIKIITDCRSIPVEENIPWDFSPACKVAEKWYNGATFITEGTKNFIQHKYGLKYKKYAIIPSAVDPSLFSPVLPENGVAKIKEFTKDRITIFYHGSISRNRGVNLIIEAVNQIKNTFPNILFMSVSNANNYINNYCSEKNYKLNDNLYLINPVRYDKMAAYINLADICIIPLPKINWWEISSPLKLMEYLAMEKPIVLSNIKAHRKVVPVNSKFALYFNPNEPNDLGEKITQAITNIEEMKNNSYIERKIILKKYTWDIQAKNLEKFIQTI